MAKRKIQNRRRINLTVEEDCYIELEKLAAKKNCTIPDVIREHIDNGLTNNFAVENIDLITWILREQLTTIIDPAINRIAALTSKATIQSTTAAYLAAEAMLKFVPKERQEEFQDSYEAARKKAISYIKGKLD